MSKPDMKLETALHIARLVLVGHEIKKFGYKKIDKYDAYDVIAHYHGFLAIMENEMNKLIAKKKGEYTGETL